jgi:hypothetical protein
MITNKKITIGLALLWMVFAACNKDQQAEHAIQVSINGYNGSSNALMATIDTTAYDQKALNGNFIIKPASIFEFNAVYTYFPNQQSRMVTLTDTVTKKTIFTKPLYTTGTKASFNFLFVDGKELDVPSQAVDTATNKLSFYIHYPANDASIDIFLFKKDNTTGKEDRTYMAKSVKPNTWIHMNYVADTTFGNKSVLGSVARIYFTKAGTTDQWAFDDNENKSKMNAFGMALPLTKEKGLVQTYFLIPGKLEVEKARLFFHPDRPW